VTGARKLRVDVDITGRGPAGCSRMAADLFVPGDLSPELILWCCVPGGGANRGYFDLNVPREVGEYSMARFAVDRGVTVLTIDPPGVGESDSPDDGYCLTPKRVADAIELVVTEITARLAAGAIGGVPALRFHARIGIGHSAGALLVACQQAYHRSYGALALLGFSDTGLPEVLTEEELAFAGRPEELHEVLPQLVEARFGQPFPELGASDLGMSSPDPVAKAALMAESRLLALVGMMALIPGSMKPELDRIDVPTLVAFGDHDIAGDIAALPGQLPGCTDLTLITLKNTGHNHNHADSRLLLWRRLIGWGNSLEASP
jgi:pimeloyl-ACP methyl ester carboxylesterase